MDEGLRREDLAVHVRRENVFEDSFRELHRRSPDEWKHRFYIVYEGAYKAAELANRLKPCRCLLWCRALCVSCCKNELRQDVSCTEKCSRLCAR